MNRTSGPDGPEDVDATFAKIVADLRAEGFGTDGSDTGDVVDPDDADDLLVDTDDEDGRSGRTRLRSSRDPDPAPPTGSGWRESGTGWDETMFGDDRSGTAFEDDDEHFVPPEPPPLPRPRKGAIVVLLFFVVGLVLLVAPGLIGLGQSVALPLGMLSLAIGIALALLRVKQGPPDGADPTNGAQV
ncbi:hypothetical protein ACWGRK_12915 [Saccharomonospora azurea]|uniref:DUF308 domain-containing protein n=1 Tax=Saccharomonospora azurea NA-128 TaxID=882081 RepID=H8G4I5_9PSEU|nr:hypothetical protein [Saccharomonospora azurea]EHY88134.1 hypothetical protein SacazDRAFT_01198 [Saccharomonospora azurea NA-128]